MSINPVIIIPGFGQSKLTVDGKNAWPLNIDQKALIGELKGSLMKMMLFRTDGGFSDKIAAIVEEATDLLSVKADGTKKYDVKPLVFEKSFAQYTSAEKQAVYKNFPCEAVSEKVGEDKMFYFAYDFLGDVSAVAEALDKFVSLVKAKTGSEKVNFLVYSTGGAVLKAYLKDFAVKCDCEKAVNFSAFLDGSTAVADIYENKLQLDNPAELLASLGGKGASLSSVAGMLPADVIENVVKKSFAVLKKNLLDSCTMLWALIPPGRFESILASQNSDAVFAGKVKAMNEYSPRFVEDAKELEFYQLCGCGNSLPAIFDADGVDSDGILDVVSASLAGSLPETTWYFKNQNHTGALYNDIAMKLAAGILSDEINSVNSSAAFPAHNGSRNIKKLKTELIPKAKAALGSAESSVKTKLEECISEYEDILSVTVIENGANVKKLEEKLSAVLQNINGGK